MWSIHQYYRAPRPICPLLYRLSASLVDRGEFIKSCQGGQTCLTSKISSSHTFCTRSTCTGTPLSTHFIFHRGFSLWPRGFNPPPPQSSPACRTKSRCIRESACPRIGLSANRHVRESVCPRIGLSAKRHVRETVCPRIGCPRIGMSAKRFVR
jgi:hypothetical protein